MARDATATAGGPIASVAVVGGGQVALLAATALARAMPDRPIALIRAPVDPAALADTAHTTLPTLARLHRRIGITERLLLDRAGATHRLAIRYDGWRGDGAADFVGYGAAADPALFRAAPRPVDLGAAAAVARAGRFALPDDDAASPLSDLDHAVRFDRAAHVAALTALAGHLGITIARAPIARVARDEDGRVASIETAAGERFAADLVVDCAGPSSGVRSPVQRWIDWSADLPIDRLAYPAHPAPPRLAAVDTALAFDGGYLLESPGRDATHRVIGWSSDAVATPDALASVLARLGGGDPAAIVSLRRGRLAEAWCDNVVAFGDAAASIDPIGWTNLHLAIVQIETFLDLLPRHTAAAAERKEFNRRVGLAADRVADYVAAHSVSRRWAAATPSATLARTIAAFTRRGRLPAFEEESIPRDQWAQLLAFTTPGAGPAAYVEGLAPAERVARTTDVARRLADARRLSEPYDTALTRLLREPA